MSRRRHGRCAWRSSTMGSPVDAPRTRTLRLSRPDRRPRSPCRPRSRNGRPVRPWRKTATSRIRHSSRSQPPRASLARPGESRCWPLQGLPYAINAARATRRDLRARGRGERNSTVRMKGPILPRADTTPARRQPQPSPSGKPLLDVRLPKPQHVRAQPNPHQLAGRDTSATPSRAKPKLPATCRRRQQTIGHDGSPVRGG